MDHLLAAVDLGSNSFRLSIGRVEQREGKAQIYATDRLREFVRLADGLDGDKKLTEEALERALAVLERFGERLQGFPAPRVRAVATNTLRVARNAGAVLPRMEAALGFPIEIISGQEEARLIFSGVSHELPPSEDRRLMIDIGGGSTEVIIGQGFRPLHLSSLPMGCATYTQRFFPGGGIDESRMALAVLAARRELEGIARSYRRTGWREAYGSSGTAKGLVAILRESGMSPEGITLKGLQKLRDKLIRDGRVIMDELPGIKADRALVLAGGVAIMLAAFQELSIARMAPGEGALRVGVLYDLLGRDSHHDKRDETVKQFIQRHHVDARQAARVRRIALALFDQSGLADEPDGQELRRTLSWAADLHEIGLSIAHADYPKHSAYILRHADMPGFSHDDQALLALFAQGHQGKLSKLPPPAPTRGQWLTLLCLRLAVLLSRRRDDPGAALPLALRLPPGNRQIRLRCDRRWLATHALSEYSLRAEGNEWEKAGFTWRLEERDLLDGDE